MTANMLCIRCGLSRDDHVHTAVGLVRTQQLAYDDASRRCTSFSSGDLDADLLEEHLRKLAGEEEYLSELRFHSKPKTHWD
jgi:hypothetical protein